MAQDGMFGATATGALSGAGTGAAIGSIIPGIGTAIGAGVGALAGGIGAGVKQKRSNEAQQLPLVDPMERARLATLAQQRKSLSAGTDTLTQQNIQQQQNIGKAAQTALSRSTGGDVGQTMNALLQSQKATQGGVNQAIAQTQNRIPYFDSAQGGLLSRISDRKLQLGRLMRDQRVAENAQSRTDANINAQSLLATQGGVQTIPEGLSQAGGQIGGFLSNLNLGGGGTATQGAPVGVVNGVGTPGIPSNFAPGYNLPQNDFLNTQTASAPQGMLTPPALPQF